MTRRLVQFIDKSDCVICEYLRCRGKELHTGDVIELWSNEPTITKLSPYRGPFAYLYQHGAQSADLSDHKGMITIDNDAFYDINAHVFRRSEEARRPHEPITVTADAVARLAPSAAFALAKHPAPVDGAGIATASMAACLRTTMSEMARNAWIMMRRADIRRHALQHVDL